MSTTLSRRLVVAATATCLLAGGVSTTAAEAAKKPTAKSVDKKVKKTDKRVASTRKSLKKTQSGLASTQAGLKKTDTSLAAASTQIGAAVTRLTAAEGSIAGILAVAPQLATGLQTLATAVQTQIAPGLQTLGSAYQSVEYGRAGIFATGGTVVAGQFVTSSDVPDDSNQAQMTDDAIIAAPPTGGTVSLDLRANIRSAEGDQTGTTGQAGGSITATDAAGNMLFITCTPTAPGSPTIAPVAGTPAADFATPAGTKSLNLVNVPGVTRTADQATAGTTASLLPNTVCAITAPVGPSSTTPSFIKVHYSVQFVDIPTSTTPGPTE